MLLRARYFLDLCYSYLETAPGYSPRKNFLSRECLDILAILIEGLISLILIHRKFHPHLPLLPWLHSSEACEHLFGIARQVVADFSFYDFMKMLPKLSVRIRERFLKTSFSEHSAEMKAQAAGYHHTYFDNRKLNISALILFPNDIEINHAAVRASDEADSLALALGIDPYHLPVYQKKKALPGISVFFRAADGDCSIHESDFEADPGCEDSDDEYKDTDSVIELQHLVDETQHDAGRFSPLSNANTSRVDNLTHAALALTIDDYMSM